MNLRKLARGQDCKLRIPMCCNFNPETTVLAHIRLGFGGIGIKPTDWCGVHACSSCHDAIDGRAKTQFTKDELHAMTLRGLCEQLRWYEAKGVLK